MAELSPSPAAEASPTATAELSPSPAAVTQAPTTAPAAPDQGGLPPWLWLGLPLIGGLLWWLTKGRGPVAAPVAAAPVAAAPVAAPAVSVAPAVAASAVAVPAVAASAVAPAAVPVPIVPPVRDIPEGRMILTPRDCRNAYAYWEVDEERRAQARQQGGRKLALRLYDVTDVEIEHQVPHSVKQFDCRETEPDLQLPISVDDRDYMAELGYVTEDGRWLKIACSEHIRVPACPVEPVPAALLGAVRPVASAPVVPVAPAAPAAPDLGAVTALAGGAALAGAAALNFAKSKSPEPVAPIELAAAKSRIVLTPRDSDHAYAYWEMPEAEKATAKAQGGEQLLIRLYDVTSLSPELPLPPAIEQFSCTETDQDLHLMLPDTNRDYLAELGYLSADGRWLELARSNSIQGLDKVAPVAGLAGVGLAGAGLAGAGLAGATRSVVSESRPAETDRQQPVAHDVKQITVHSRHNCFLLNSDQMRHLQEQTAVTKDLQPGLYQIRIKSGTFGYGVTPEHSEPLVMLWIAGGKIINKETNVPVAATWSTLNGYDDVITLEVLESTVLHAFFFDTHVEDNDGEVTLVVTQQA